MADLKYASRITEIGSLALDFCSEGMLILFKAGAPADIRDLSVVHEAKTALRGCPARGDRFIIGDTEYRITAVGELACRNLEQLGHVTLKFDGATEAALPGNIHLSPPKLPAVRAGDGITINS